MYKIEIYLNYNDIYDWYEEIYSTFHEIKPEKFKYIDADFCSR